MGLIVFSGIKVGPSMEPEELVRILDGKLPPFKLEHVLSPGSGLGNAHSSSGQPR